MLLILSAIALAIIAYWIHMRVRHMSILSRNGIPGPKPNLFVGNLFEYRKTPSVIKHKEWIETYGKIMGYYSGAKPTVLVADPDLAKSIQIKDFQYFTDRQELPVKFGIHPNPAIGSMVIRLRGKRWKEVRSALTPTFSASKLKTMTPIMEDTVNNFIDIIEKRSEKAEEFDIYPLFQNLTTDVIGRTAFGFQSNVQNESNNKFLNAAKAAFNQNVHKSMILFIQCFPLMDNILYPFRRLVEIIRERRGESADGILLDMARDVIQLRKQNPSFRRKDLLQLMLDSRISDEEMSAMSNECLTVDNVDKEVKSNGEKGVTNSPKSIKSDIRLTELEIRANCVLFYEGGYETTSTALAFMAHNLVNYPEHQERIREEVKQLYESEGKLDFNTVNKLEFMEWVLNETMRLYPPFITFVSRHCLTDYKYKHMTIPKGTSVMFAVHYLHHDPDYWTEPEKFDPFRFSPERSNQIHTSSWQPFGSGPRNCIGMRFALFEAKLAMAKLLLQYRLEAGPKTEIGKLSTDYKVSTLTPKNGVYVKAIKL